ncbi:MAG: NAD(P)/FAD-dependent oxidoreductase [Chlorobi bacterium]|nr:NAD(P)/FAD-dependent oxidoreductase [Chlorobiota bacterium]
MKKYIANIPETDKKRVVIVGGGFAGIKVMRKVNSDGFQTVLIDKNNFHQFQPLLYQVATAGLEPSTISFPVRKILQNEKDVHFRIAEILEVHADEKEISTTIGSLKYDHLILAIGANTNFFGQENIMRYSLSMKTASDAILIRNTILENFEKALLETDDEKISQYMNIVLVGGGPTGVELAGALAEMKKYIFPKDYPELDLSKMRIVVYEASPRILAGMSDHASRKALSYLRKLGVEVYTDTSVEDYDGNMIKLSDKSSLSSKTLIWAAGIKANPVTGLKKENFGRGNRMKVDRFNRLLGYKHIYALGDVCIMESPKYPNGQPQVAQVAIQQASNLANNLHRLKAGKTPREFEYKNKGSMATIGRNLAVADLPFAKLKGFFAWVLWSFVHLFMIIGVKNRLSIFINWSWNYLTYDQSLRVLIKPKRLDGNQNSQTFTKRG